MLLDAYVNVYKYLRSSTSHVWNPVRPIFSSPDSRSSCNFVQLRQDDPRTITQNRCDGAKRAEIVMETEEAFCPSAEEIERWMDSAFDMVG